MKQPPYTFTEAAQLCADFQHLNGEPYSRGDQATIQCIAVVPFDQINKQKFIVYYHLLNDATLALNHEYKGLLFDVLVLASYPDKCDLLHCSLNSWVDEMVSHPIMASHGFS